MTTLRWYQVKAKTLLLEAIAAGHKRVILQMPTGSGKTAVFCDMLIGCSKKGNRGLMVVKGAKLVHQAAARLAREDVPHGLYQANNSRGAHHNILACSIDTLKAREIAPDADFIVIDEVHLTQGASYKWLLGQEKYKDTIILGVTATPFAADGLEHVATKIIRPVTINELIEHDPPFLVGGKYFVPHIPDLGEVGSNKKDYISKQLTAKLKEQSSVIFGELEKAWNQHGKGTRSIVFCVSVQHARDTQSAMQKFGVRCAHIDASIGFTERDDIIRQLEAGEIDAITSVGCLTTGVDIPSLQTIFMLRPTKSYNLWVQMLGRGTRPYEGKRFFTLVDLSGNLYKHGPIESELMGQLEPTKGPPPSPKNYICPTCLNQVTRDFCEMRFGPFECMYRDFDHEHIMCPACGTDMCREFWSLGGGGPSIVSHEDAELKEYLIPEWEKKIPVYVDIAKKRGWKKGWIIKQIEVKFGEEEAEQAYLRVKNLRRWPLRGTPDFTQNSAKKPLSS